MSTDSDTPAYQDKHTLRRLYIKEGLSQSAIADRLGTTKATVSRWLRTHDIETKGQGKRNQYSDADLLDALRDVAATTVGRPTKAQCNAAEGPSASTIETRFGSWTAALDAAGIDPAHDSTRETLEKGFGSILQSRPDAARELVAADPPFFQIETGLSDSDIQVFARSGILRHATDQPVENTALVDSHSLCWQWEPADGVRQWIVENVDPRGECPAEDCRETGISNLGDGVFTCMDDECDETFDRKTAEEVLGG